jgi:hypothetical protein
MDQVGGVRRPGRARQDNQGEVRRGGRSEGGGVEGPGKVLHHGRDVHPTWVMSTSV